MHASIIGISYACISGRRRLPSRGLHVRISRFASQQVRMMHMLPPTCCRWRHSGDRRYMDNIFDGHGTCWTPPGLARSWKSTGDMAARGRGSSVSTFGMSTLLFGTRAEKSTGCGAMTNCYDLTNDVRQHKVKNKVTWLWLWL